MTDSLNLHKPQRQAPLGVAVMFVQNLRRAINIFVAVVVVNFGRDFSILGLGYLEIAYIISTFFLIFSYLQYRRFTFYVKGDNFIIEKGVLKQDKISVPFGRIQTVNTRQNLVQQLFNLVGLKIDTAGSVQQEINIPALSKSYAQALQEFLMEQRYELQNEEDVKLQEDSEVDITDSIREESSLLLSIDIPMLLKVGLTQNHLRSGLVLFAIVNGYFWQYEDLLLQPLEPYLAETAESFLTSWLILLPITVVAFLVVSVLSSLVTTILRYFGFKFYLGEKGLSIESGLFARNAFHVPFRKIQYFKWEANPLQALLGYRTLRVKQAGAEAINDKKLIAIPGLAPKQLLKILNQRYKARKVGRYSYFKPHILLRNQRFFVFGLLPISVLGALFYFQDLDWWTYLPLPLIIILCFFWSTSYWQHYHMRVNANFIELKKGYFIPKRILLPVEKIQNIALNQSFLQKRRGIGTLVLYTAAGSERVSHLPYEESLALYNYLLYKVESSPRNWM